MGDYDAIVIGAGHNGLTAAAVMARGGLRVLCLEKNHFIGGMATTTELARGYRFELAGSIQFPLPNEIYDDLGFSACPIYEPEVQSASIGAPASPAPPLQRPGTAARAPERGARARRRHGHGRGGRLGRGAGPGHRALRRPQAAEVARRDVGLRRQRAGA
jgi:phytoene dehydrogenase-like protein